MKSLLLSTILLALPFSVSAHRLDEYLQASRILVSSNRIEVSMELTPGVAVAADVLAKVDMNKNGVVSEEEGKQYAKKLLSGVRFELDGKRCLPELLTVTFPSPGEMRVGHGTIRLKASVAAPSLAEGHHELRFQNKHLPEISVYHVNALVPTDDAIVIIGQTRDPLQKDYRLEFKKRISAQAPAGVAACSFAVRFMAGAICGFSCRIFPCAFD